MVRNITEASEQYREALGNCRQVFQAAGREFVEPKGMQELLHKARKLFAEQGDEASAIKEVEHAAEWLIGIAVKFLRGGIEFFEGRIAELSYMSLDQDIMDNMRARLKDYCAALMQEEGPAFDQRIEAYTALATAVNGARAEQARRLEHRELVARQREAEKAQERRERRRQQEEQDQLQARQRQEAAEAEARVRRAEEFDRLFS